MNRGRWRLLGGSGSGGFRTLLGLSFGQGSSFEVFRRGGTPADGLRDNGLHDGLGGHARVLLHAHHGCCYLLLTFSFADDDRRGIGPRAHVRGCLRLFG